MEWGLKMKQNLIAALITFLIVMRIGIPFIIIGIVMQEIYGANHHEVQTIAFEQHTEAPTPTNYVERLNPKR